MVGKNIEVRVYVLNCVFRVYVLNATRTHRFKNFLVELVNIHEYGTLCPRNWTSLPVPLKNAFHYLSG